MIRGRVSILVAVSVLTLTAGGCGLITDVEPREPTLWEGEVVSVGSVPVHALVAAISRRLETTASIQLNAEPQNTYQWRIRTGTCAEPGGEVVGATDSYPTLETDRSGSASAKTILGETMDAGEAFHAVILSADADSLLGCGTLHELSGGAE